MLAPTEKALVEAGASFRVKVTERQGHATTLVREALEEGASGIAVIGGDGTFNEAMNGFWNDQGQPIRPEAWFAPLPCGTGGDLRRTLMIPQDPVQAARQMMQATPAHYDCGWIRLHDRQGREVNRSFLNIASVGMAGLVDELVNSSPKWLGGRLSFLWGTLRAIAKYKAPRVRISIDGQPVVERRITNIAIANGRYFGGGMHIAPEASMQDGVFDIVTVSDLPALSQLSMIPSIYGTGVISRPGVISERGTRIEIEAVDSEERVLLDVDGETPGVLPAVFEIRTGGIRLRH
jgi:YegS/Rv2252/BmrU family lipid kinase